MNLAIVIPCRNQISFTKLCLQSLFFHTAGPYRLIVIDNESSDGTADWVKSFCAWLGIPCDVLSYAGTNLSAIWNLGVRRAAEHGCELVAVINNDIAVAADWDAAFVDHFARNPATWCAVPECMSSVIDEAFLSEATARAGRTDVNPMPDWFPGYFMVFRTAALIDLGLFDERYRIWYGDTDIRKRLNAAGRPAVRLNRVPIVHFGSKTTGSVADHHAIIAEDRAKFFAKYGET